MTSKFSCNPYNNNNSLITSNEVINICKKHNVDYTVTDISLFQKSFIHKSYCNMKEYDQYENDTDALPIQMESYETLEFLGDSIIGSIVSGYIYKRYIPYNIDEGFLTRVKNRIVSGEGLSQLAIHLGFSKYLIISKHIEDNCNGRNNTNILEDTFEAFIGALYLDSTNYAMVEKFLIDIIECYVDFTDIIVVNTNYKDQLLRYFQSNFKTYPIYETLEENGSFKCNVYNGDLLIETSQGDTKKKSEQNVSKRALIYYGILN